MKQIILIFILFTSVIQAQLHADVRAGTNYYFDEGSISNFQDDVAFGFSYEIDDIVRPRLMFNIGKLVNEDHGYETNYYGVDFDVLINIKRAFFFETTNKVWKIYPYVGLGRSVFEDQDVTTMNAGIINTFKLSPFFYLGLEAGAKGLYSLDHPVGCAEYPSRLTGANGFLWYGGLNMSIRFWEPKKKTKTEINERVIEKTIELTPSVIYNTCTDCIEEKPETLKYYFYFDENERNLDAKNKDNSRELKRLYKDLGDYPTYYVDIEGRACGGHGTEAYNKKISEDRAKSVSEYIEEETGEYFESRGTGVGREHTNMKLNRVVIVTLSKEKL